MRFNFATGLDLNMGYLSLPLDELSKVILMIIMPFRLFECQVLPQEVKPATDIFQGQINSLFSHLKRNASKIYLDGFDDHLKHLEYSKFSRKQVCKSMQRRALGVQWL